MKFTISAEICRESFYYRHPLKKFFKPALCYYLFLWDKLSHRHHLVYGLIGLGRSLSLCAFDKFIYKELLNMTPLYRLFSIEGREDDNSGTYQELKNKNSDAT